MMARIYRLDMTETERNVVLDALASWNPPDDDAGFMAEELHDRLTNSGTLNTSAPDFRR